MRIYGYKTFRDPPPRPGGERTAQRLVLHLTPEHDTTCGNPAMLSPTARQSPATSPMAQHHDAKRCFFTAS